jgi:hypothetical protein
MELEPYGVMPEGMAGQSRRIAFEAERDEWRGYFDRMVEGLHQLGYTPEPNPCSMLLQALMSGADPSEDGGT